MSATLACLRRTAALAALAAGLSFAAVQAAGAQDAAFTAVSERVLFVVSGGFWQGPPEASVEKEPAESEGESADAGQGADGDSPAGDADLAGKRGYYRLVALRGEDNTSQVYLQQIALAGDGPELVMTLEIEEISELSAFVTDVRNEGATGAPGYSAFVYLKTDPSAAEADIWTVFVDDFGEVSVSEATN